MRGEAASTGGSDLEEQLRAAEELIAQLRLALESSRDIGAAVGVIMWSRRVTREEAFDLLREASMRRNRKVRVLALEVIETGVLPTA